MPDGHINAALVDRSPRLMRIIEVLKDAEHPLSSQEISVRAYDFGASGKVMLNVSTNIGEIRSPRNIESGYIVSEARSWKTGRYPWHDGRPRYWLIAAPGWTPRWTIDESGELHVAVRARAKVEQERLDLGSAVAVARTCMNCGIVLPASSKLFCGIACKDSYFGVNE